MIAKFTDIYLKLLQILGKFFAPLLMLLLRFWMARIFWYSGLTKISDWQSTIFLFKNEYKVPVIPPELAASLSTMVELSCPILLITGFATRLATLPMLAMTFVIQFTYEYSNEHYYWAMLLASILIYGPGPIAVDNLIKKKIIKSVERV